MGNKKATGFLCLRLVPCFAYVGAEDNRKGIPFVKIVSLLCKLIQFLMVALSVTVHKALILLVFLNHPYQSLAFSSFFSLLATVAISMNPITKWWISIITYFDIQINPYWNRTLTYHFSTSVGVNHDWTLGVHPGTENSLHSTSIKVIQSLDFTAFSVNFRKDKKTCFHLRNYSLGGKMVDFPPLG